MLRTILRVLIAAAASCVSLAAAAGPGAAITGLAILPANVPKVVAAIDTYMATSAGKQSKGRLLMLQNIADGADPSTHELVVLYHSMAEYEAFNKATANDPATKALFDAVVPVSNLTFQGIGSTLRSWGDVNDTDTFWVSYYFNVKDTKAANAAIDAYLAAPVGKKFQGQGYLVAIEAAGVAPGAPNAVINVGWASMAEMEAYNDANMNDPDWLKFLAAFDVAAPYLGTAMAVQVKAWGPATAKSFVK